MILKGIDASYGTLTDDIAKRLWAAGYRVFGQCLWTGAEQPPPRVINLRVALNNGFIILGYISVTSYMDGYYHVQRGRAGVPDDIWNALALAPIDVELNGIPNLTIRQAVDALDKRKSIYTSYNCWVNKQGNPHDFTDCLLWNAGGKNWDRPDLAVPPDYVGGNFAKNPYGGWTVNQVVGEQWSGGSDVEGINADRDIFSEELLVPTHMLTPDECLRVNLANAKVLADDRDADKLVGVLKYVYAVKGWLWPS